MKDTVILIPPSEGKKPGGRGKPLNGISPEVKTMVDRLKEFEGDWEKLLGVKGKALEQAIHINRQITRSPTLPAIERYAGVVYAGIDYPTLQKTARDFLNTHVRILSAVFGLIGPEEQIPDYKLKVEKLDAQKFWKPVLNRQMKDKFVIDLLPQSHRKAVEFDEGISVEFNVIKNGKLVAAGHEGKFIKGRFVRFLCEEKITDPKKFSGFREDGFVWDGSAFVKRTT